MIRLEGVGKSFGEKRVLKDVSFALGAGERLAIEGPSGCGKTTLLNVMMGLLMPDAGSVWRRDGLRVAAVFQEDRLIENMNARENVRLAARKPAGEIDAALAAVGLEGEEEKRVRKLSGGQRRRVAIVRAALAGPELLLLDEPFKGLDAQTREKTAAFLLEQCPHAAVVLVSHDPNEAQLLGVERIIRLSRLDPAPEA